jgi:hypothetical protein
LSEDEYRKLLERVAAMKPAAADARRPNRLSITARKNQPLKERAELQFGDTPQGARRAAPK